MKSNPPPTLRKLRNNKKQTLESVSKIIGCTAGMLSQIETGQRNPSPKLALKISVFYQGQITTTRLLYGSD
jgi:transcriptional regulator with XRE-family HTH domain